MLRRPLVRLGLVLLFLLMVGGSVFFLPLLVLNFPFCGFRLSLMSKSESCFRK